MADVRPEMSPAALWPHVEGERLRLRRIRSPLRGGWMRLGRTLALPGDLVEIPVFSESRYFALPSGIIVERLESYWTENG